MAATETDARRVARAALAVDVARLAPEVVAKAKHCLLDFLGCAFETGELEWSRQALQVTRRVPDGANVIGTDVTAHPGDAAFVNAVLGHGLVREDMHTGSISHLGIVIWPMLLALAQARKASGADLLAAAVAGYETGGRVGRALFDADMARLFRPTGLVGPVAAAVAGSRLRRVSEDACTHALSLGVNTALGLNQWPHSGGSEMYLHPGFAARNAVTAVELAEAGVYASEDILEGEAGLFAAYRRGKPRADVTLFADGKPEILAVYFKPVPACNYAQTACQAALQVAAALGDERRKIKSVAISVSDAARRYPGCDYLGPFDRALQGKMSIQYVAAAALARGVAEERNYQMLADAEILRLVGATALLTDTGFTSAYPGKQGTEVAVTLDDGRRVARRVEDVIPATQDQVRARFRQSAAARLGEARMRAIEAAVDRLEQSDDAGRIAALSAAPAAKKLAS